jgi:hypothetical protein
VHQSLHAVAPRALWPSLDEPFHRHAVLVHTAWPKATEDLFFGAALFAPLVHTSVQVCRAPDLEMYELLVCRIYESGGCFKFDEKLGSGQKRGRTKDLKGIDITLDVAQCAGLLHLRP